MTHLQAQIKLLLRTAQGIEAASSLVLFGFVFFNEKNLKTNQKGPNITLTTRSYSRLRSDLSVTDVVIKPRKETKTKKQILGDALSAECITAPLPAIGEVTFEVPFHVARPAERRGASVFMCAALLSAALFVAA